MKTSKAIFVTADREDNLAGGLAQTGRAMMDNQNAYARLAGEGPK